MSRICNNCAMLLPDYNTWCVVTPTGNRKDFCNLECFKEYANLLKQGDVYVDEKKEDRG